MKQILFNKAIGIAYPNQEVRINNGIVSFLDTISDDSDTIQLNIKTEYDKLNALEPMRLLRQERDRLLLSTDWAGNSDVTMPQNIAIYRQALRDLPQDIAAGKIVAPTIDNNGNLVFNFPTI